MRQSSSLLRTELSFSHGFFQSLHCTIALCHLATFLVVNFEKRYGLNLVLASHRRVGLAYIYLENYDFRVSFGQGRQLETFVAWSPISEKDDNIDATRHQV